MKIVFSRFYKVVNIKLLLSYYQDSMLRAYIYIYIIFVRVTHDFTTVQIIRRYVVGHISRNRISCSKCEFLFRPSHNQLSDIHARNNNGMYISSKATNFIISMRRSSQTRSFQICFYESPVAQSRSHCHRRRIKLSLPDINGF